jgi:hypothetical protein
MAVHTATEIESAGFRLALLVLLHRNRAQNQRTDEEEEAVAVSLVEMPGDAEEGEEGLKQEVAAAAAAFDNKTAEVVGNSDVLDIAADTATKELHAQDTQTRHQEKEPMTDGAQWRCQ